MKNIYTVLAVAALTMGAEVSAQTVKADNGGTFRASQRSTSVVHQRVTRMTNIVDDSARGGVANDECANATSINVVPEGDCASGATAGNNSAALTGALEPSCDDPSDAGYQDVWYTFNSGANEGVLIDLTPGDDMTDWGIAIYDACEGGEVGCELLPEEAFSLAVTTNTNYYVRIWSNLDWGVGGPFTLCISEYDIPDAPVNDDCTGADNQALAVGSTISFSGDNTGATEDGGTGYLMVWHSFTTTACANITINYCVEGSVFQGFLVNLAVGCPDFLSGLLTGVYDECTVSFEGLAPGTYYVPVMVDPTDTPVGPYTIEVSAATCAPAPANDECAGAISLTAGAACVTTAGTLVGTMQSMAPATCSTFLSNAAKDAWYSFVAPSAQVDVIATSSVDLVMEIFSGSCGNLTSLTCIDAGTGGETLEMLNLVANNTYYVRLYGWNGATGEFDICAVNNGPVGVNDLTGHAFSVFPNPTNGDITISGADLSGTVLFELTDMTGRIVYSERRGMVAKENVVLPIAGKVAAGTYSLSLLTTQGRSVRTVVVR